MWQRFTERSRKVVFSAQEEAGRRGETLVSPEHLLLGLVSESDSVAARILNRMGVSTELVRTEVESLFPVANETTSGDMQLTPKAKLVIDRASAQASDLSNNYIGTEHLLLALILDDGPSGQILAKLGVGMDAARRHVQVLQEGSSEAPSVTPVGPDPDFDSHDAFVKTLWPYFSEEARAIVFYAQREAACRGESHITAVHLLRALTSETNSTAARILNRVGIGLNDIRPKLEEDSPHGPSQTYKDIHLAQDAIQCVGAAYDEAQQLGQDFIGTEHLLLGLMRDGGVAGSILASMGIDLDTLHNAVRIQRRDPVTGGKQEAYWTHFTDRARKVVYYAQEEAARLGENYVSTEHLLLGLVRENNSVAARILDRVGVSLGRIRGEIERQVAHGSGRLGQDMQLTPRGKRVLDLAYDEARQLSNNYIGTEHLLLALIREGEGVGGRVLSKLGVDLDRTRREVWLLQEGPVASRWRTYLAPAGINLESLISSAITAAKKLGHDAPSSEHFLMALFAAEDGRAADVLDACDITPEIIENTIAGLA